MKVGEIIVGRRRDMTRGEERGGKGGKRGKGKK